MNLPLYPSGTTVIAAEPSPDMIRKAKAKWKDNDIQAKVEWLEAGVGDQKLEEYVAPNSLDAVVATLVLCTVSDAQDAINRFYHFLKPGGQLIVLEHIKSSSTPGTFLQNMLTPVWKHIAEGCHLNRPTDQMVKESGFKIVEEEYFTKGVPFFEAVCQKPGA